MYKSSRLSPNRNLFILFLIMLLAALLLTRCVSAGRGASLKVSGTEDIVRFLAGFGWEAESEPVTVKNVQIPAKFGDVYESYNELQKKQGFDLSKYRSNIVESYTMRIMNHEADGDVFANVLIFKGRIIGGDICSFALNGFMTDFTGKLSM